MNARPRRRELTYDELEQENAALRRALEAARLEIHGLQISRDAALRAAAWQPLREHGAQKEPA